MCRHQPFQNNLPIFIRSRSGMTEIDGPVSPRELLHPTALLTGGETVAAGDLAGMLTPLRSRWSSNLHGITTR